ncbi:DEAD/DEAH box helicase [Hyphococcus formosus]|uniref:DEAD/DEAH box helicase n=1 Tax=Hyphococcus formosus TaxID=3143534 RepID=UPI00398B920D
MTQFSDFGLARPIMQALADEKHTTPTPIQAEAIPAILRDRDLLGIAQTGSGKTAAFALPILHRLVDTPHQRRPGDCRALILTPTRELSAQVLDRFRAYGRRLNLRMGLVIGGAPMGKQKAMARKGVDVLVATPGRLVDLIEQKAIDLSRVETLVLDEVDQMLDLGFIHAIRSITQKLPTERQSIFFSATMPREIAKLAGSLLQNPARVEIAAQERPKIDQSVRFIDKGAKATSLLEIVNAEEFTRGLVFTRTKHGADKVVRFLDAAGIRAHAIHGNRSQPQRERALAAFRSGKASVLVATDIAARGIDIRDVTHVVNYDLPNVPETYVHRIGRTARAGAAGIAISFCANDERPYLRSIEKLTREKITVTHGEDIPFEGPKRGRKPPRRRKPRPGNGAPKEPFKNEKRTSGNGPKVAANDEKRKEHGERGTTRVRRRRNRGAAGRKFSSHAG